MSKKMTGVIMMVALVIPGIGCWADGSNATGNDNDPVHHPVNAYTNHEVKEDIKASEVNSQQAAEAKATYKQAKQDYKKSRKDNGVNSTVTVAAKKRMHDAYAEMCKYNKKTTTANQELQIDQIKAHQ